MVEYVGSNLGPKLSFVPLLFQLGRLTPPVRNTSLALAYAVHPLIGGGVAEWLKAAVC